MMNEILSLEIFLMLMIPYLRQLQVGVEVDEVVVEAVDEVDDEVVDEVEGEVAQQT
jgi:hypothetical protein